MLETKAAPQLEAALSRPRSFMFGAVEALQRRTVTLDTAPPLGPLVAFTGTFQGNGFNTIFRPNLGSPTPLPNPPTGQNDNILELNLTSETLSFSPPLGAVPNRGEVQPDVFLNGVPYLQTISDVTDPSQPVGIHFEPGLWLNVPATSAPTEVTTLVRMASIPHGTTIDAQGTSQDISGAPTIPAVDITPSFIGGGAFRFPSQNAASNNTFRIPQDLSSFITAGTITQAILDDPNTVLRNAIAGQTITSTTIISISTNPASPLFGGGAGNIAFLGGDPSASRPNAQTTQMDAMFWIETVQHVIIVPPHEPGHGPVLLRPEANGSIQELPEFIVDPPRPLQHPVRLTVTSTQIQYSQRVILNFNGLLWPHVSVATLTPMGGVPVPPSVWQ
jgi:hypothetical protein